MKRNLKIAIIGGGTGGLTAACALPRLGSRCVTGLEVHRVQGPERKVSGNI